ncbi:MAG: alpha/beta fold hydrolase [Chloroflexales bacterium]|nr:alpha/beta fold hydrolase [Chloroflexales bacterium]
MNKSFAASDAQVTHEAWLPPFAHRYARDHLAYPVRQRAPLADAGAGIVSARPYAGSYRAHAATPGPPQFSDGAERRARLADHFTVYTYDRRGRGESGDTQPYAGEREVEDLAAVIGAAGGQAFVYGISVGAALALHAAAALGPALIPRLALCEPPYSVGAEEREAFRKEQQHIGELLAAGQPGEAAATFLSEIMPPPMLDELRASPDWTLLEAHAPTLAYDYTILGDGGHRPSG